MRCPDLQVLRFSESGRLTCFTIIICDPLVWLFGSGFLVRGLGLMFGGVSWFVGGSVCFWFGFGSWWFVVCGVF